MYVLENRKWKMSILMWNFYSRRLWHQLTQVLLKLVQRPELRPKLKEIYENAISEFETRLNPLSLVQIITPVVGAMEDKVWSREIIHIFIFSILENLSVRIYKAFKRGVVAMNYIRSRTTVTIYSLIISKIH